MMMVRDTTVVMVMSLLCESFATTTGIAGCAGVVQCLDHSQCAQCLSAVNATAGFTHSYAEFYTSNGGSAYYHEFHAGFFHTLQSTSSCSTGATPPMVMYPALQELSNTSSPCNSAYVDPPPFEHRRF
jgi:hypothetical protein